MSENMNSNVNNVVVNNVIGVPQRGRNVPWIIRAVYFLLIGFWLTFIWVMIAYLCLLTIIGIPVAQRMFEVAPTVATLK